MELLRDITVDDFRQSGWEQVVAECEEKECSSYASCFAAKATGPEHAGNIKAQQIFRLLSAITSLYLKLDQPEEPYGPMMVMHDRRTATIDDFDETHLNFLSEIVGEVTDAELRARIADIVWLRRPNYRMAQIAIPAYLESAKLLEHPEHWTGTADRIERALQLAARLGRNGTLFSNTIAHIENVLATYDGEDPLFLSAKLMGLLQEQKAGDPVANAARAEKAALRAEATHEWHRAREYWEIKARWHQQENDEQQARNARLRGAGTYVKEAEDALDRQPPSYMHAAAHLQFAIEALRRIGNTKDRVGELHKMLLDYQQNSTAELIPISASVDISEIIEVAAKHVAGKTLPDALASLAFISGPPSIATLRTQAQEIREKYLFQRFLPRVFMNAMGRVIARQPQDEEESLRADMFTNASSGRGIRVQALLEPARQQILSEHYVRVNDFLPLLTNNPFVRAGREIIIAHGLYAGLQGDFLTATHFLIPQLEDSIRYLLSHLGIITSGLDDDGIQEEYNLNRMLKISQLREPLERVLGEDFVFDLRGLLVERFGANLRNDVAHGLFSYGAFYTTAPYYLWWLTLRFYSLPTVAKLPGTQADADQSLNEINDATVV